MSVFEADRSAIADIDAQISGLAAAIFALRTKKAVIQERLDHYKYPVLTLPTEITSEIFIHFLPTHPFYPPLTGPYSPTQLTRICRAWREIALATPSLWGAISLAPLPNLPVARQAQEAEIWLSRSGCGPTAIEVLESSPELSPEVLNLFATHRTRWENISIDAHSALSLVPISGPMSRLRHLVLSFSYLSESTAILGFSEAPFLRTVDLTFTPSRVLLPWVQLTSLTLRYVSPLDCFSVLEQAPNLTHCHLIPSYDHDMLNQSIPPTPDITLRHLESLTLGDYQGPSIADYMSTFIVPCLRSLETVEDLLGSDPLHSLAAFMSKSGCTLREVILDEEYTISRRAYRETFPSIKFSFKGWYAGEEDEQAAEDSGS